MHHYPFPLRHAKYGHSVQEYQIGFFFRAQRVVVNPVVNYCGFGIFAIWRHERPEYAWYRGKVGNESSWYTDYIADVVTEVKFKRLVYAP